MKTAVVFCARQPFGFELCSRLLEKGYDVFAVDHHDWITDEQEENWLLIGRNANLRYFEIENEDESIQHIFSDKESLYIIPTVDYLSCNNGSARNQLLSLLQGFSEKEKEWLLLIHPPAMERIQSSFAGKINGLVELLKKDHKVMEFCFTEIPSKERDTMVLITEALGEKWKEAEVNQGVFRETMIATAVNEAICHIEQKKLLEGNN